MERGEQSGGGGGLSRRRLLGAAGAAALAVAGCGGQGLGDGPTLTPPETGADGALRGRLRERPRRPEGSGGEPGLQPLGLSVGRDGLVFVPSGYHADRPRPLVVMLNGAGGSATDGLAPFHDRADEAGLILLAPESRGRTWDVILGRYGPDVDFIDRALAQTFGRYAVDPGQVTVEGFSDGASYALGLGLTNGDLFRKIVGFSPGYGPPARQEGHPQVFISHGVSDDVLPIERCSRRIVPALQRDGYEVRYREFEGGHEVPVRIVDAALGWLGLP